MTKLVSHTLTRRRFLEDSCAAALLLGGVAAAVSEAAERAEPPTDAPDADWGPLAGPWKRYAGNPILPEPGSCPGPGSIIRYDGRWWMFIYNNNGHNTRLAVSEDGYGWRYVHDRPILTAEHRWEGSYALTKAALVIDGVVHLYYMGKQGIEERIGIATNSGSDLFTTAWKKHPDNPLFTRQHLTADIQRVFPSSVVEDRGTYYLFLDSGYDYRHPVYPRQYTINVASSPDGIRFKELAADLLVPGPDGTWDSQAVSQSAVRKVGDWWYMIYSGFPKGASKSAQAFGLARARRPHGPWQKYPGNPIFTATGDDADWDGGFVQHACPVKIDGKWHLYYAGNQRGVYRTGVAVSK